MMRLQEYLQGYRSPEYYSLKSVTVLAGGWASTAPARPRRRMGLPPARHHAVPRPLLPAQHDRAAEAGAINCLKIALS